jgi:1D-myo-inositol-tetrakisphosphate 5-kinase/inositol-polyphosphate multikinase
MTALGVYNVRPLAEPPGPLSRAFVAVENAVEVDQTEIAEMTSLEGSPPRGIETDTASLRVAPYQVAGHSSKGVGLPSLVDDAGHFLKPCPDDRKGAAEVDFYRRVVAARDSGAELSTSLAGFARFVPAYRGMFRVDAAGIVAVAGDDPTAAHARTIALTGQRAVFLRLEDITAGYRKPCVVDLKIGLRTFSRMGHDSTYIAKRTAHDTRSGQAEVGFKVCGMQTWERVEAGDGATEIGNDGKGGGGERRGADVWLQRRRPYDWARNLCDKSAVRLALEEFVGCGASRRTASATMREMRERGSHDSSFSGASGSTGGANPGASSGVDEKDSKPRTACRAAEVYGEALQQLSGLRAWFATQRELHLLGSSVLIVYEGDEDSRSSSAASTRKTRVRVIDFCNYVDARGELDDNFASGLDRLAEMMRSIVENEERRTEEEA